MKNNKFFKIIIIIFIFISFVWTTNSSNIFDNIETQINPDSSPEKIKKIQKLFYDLELYKWKINWKYKDIEKTLINYQIKKNIIKTEKDRWAWYFWKKTILALSKDFKEKFEEKSKKHLKQEKINLGKKSFIITGYYSPLPNQKKYITWTYAWDIRLNWNWKHTASWKKVFPGLIAAPKNYKFWTKIYFEWIWIWIVEDRWWAIVNAWDKWHEFDRIDVWMWEWDDGLYRAIKWWQRNVKWEILENYFSWKIVFDFSILREFYPIKLSPLTSDKNQIISMQKLFTKLWFYTWSIDWSYNSIKDTVIDFQFNNWIISSKTVDEAWYIGPKTLSFLEKKYTPGIFVKQNKYSFSIKEIKKLDLIMKKINEFLKKKAKNNTTKLKLYRKNFAWNIKRYIFSIKNNRKKLKLDYLKSKLEFY